MAGRLQERRSRKGDVGRAESRATLVVSTMCSLAFPGLVKRGVAFDRMCELLHQLDQLNVCDKFAAMLKNNVRTSDPRCDHGLQCQHVVHHADTIIPRFTGVLARRRLESGCAGGFPLFFSSLPSRYRRWQGYWWNGCRLRTSGK